MHQQKMIHGVSGGGSKKDRNTSSSTTTVNSKSSLHGFSIDALAGSSSKRGTAPDGLSSDEDDVASWDEALGDCSEDDDIDIDGDEDIGDIGGHPGAALSTTSDSSRDEGGRGGRSPPIGRRHHISSHLPTLHQQPLNHLSGRRHGKWSHRI